MLHCFPGSVHCCRIGLGVGPKGDGGAVPLLLQACFTCGFSWGELFGLVLSKAGGPANTKTDPVLSGSVDLVIMCCLFEVCEKAVLARLYSEIVHNCWVY